MVTAIVAAILFVTLILAGVGAYIVVHNSHREKEKEEALKIAMSGKYAAALCPVAELLAEKKPSKAEIEAWLNSQNFSEEKKIELAENWQKSMNETINTINKGDMSGVTAYHITLGPKDQNLCCFLHGDNFITRDQINKNAEILPPYCLGSDSAVTPKLPEDHADGTSGWKSVLPKDGQYEVPNWQQAV